MEGGNTKSWASKEKGPVGARKKGGGERGVVKEGKGVRKIGACPTSDCGAHFGGGTRPRVKQGA